jgi:ubiquinone/menaquinone biosynthesis C-methylase UbiE
VSATQYYNATAQDYDAMHGGERDPEHIVALERLAHRFFPNVHSILEVGCGTGRTLEWFSRNTADADKISLSGIDPSQGLLAVAREKLPAAHFHIGTGETLPFEDGSYDLVVATGILHHVDDPKKVIGEMFRVSKRGIIISDHNNFSFGSTIARRLRLALYAAGLLPAFSFLKQGFKKQGYSEEDGWWYPYSLFNDFDIIARNAREFFIVPTVSTNSRDLGNFMLSTSHFGVACLK